MSPAKNIHSAMQWAIQQTLYDLMGKSGRILPECSVQTQDNVNNHDGKLKHSVLVSDFPNQVKI